MERRLKRRPRLPERPGTTGPDAPARLADVASTAGRGNCLAAEDSPCLQQGRPKRAALDARFLLPAWAHEFPHAPGSIRLPACRTPSVATWRQAARFVVIDRHGSSPAI